MSRAVRQNLGALSPDRAGPGQQSGSPFGANATAAWAQAAPGGVGSRDVYVGVLDEGIQVDHPDLVGQVWTNPHDIAGDGVDNDGNGFVDDAHGWDFANGDSSVYDGGAAGTDDAHGTHVAGTIAARADGAGVVGMAWNVQLISTKFLDQQTGGTVAGAVRALDYLTDLKRRHGLNIVATNNSWTGGAQSQAMQEAIERAARAGILFVVAAGNSATNNDKRAVWPANYRTASTVGYEAVLSVAALDRNGALADFSAYGAKTVHLGAPGVDVLSTDAGGRQRTRSGTSMAAPHVTGAAVLYAATRPGATAAAVRTALLNGAAPTPSLRRVTTTGGRLDAAAALLR